MSLRRIVEFVVGTVILHYLWPVSERLGEHAAIEWINHQIAETFGIVSPSQEQVIDFIVAWTVPALAVLVIYLIFRLGARWERRRLAPDLPTITIAPTPAASANWRPIYRAIEHVSEKIGDTNTADGLLTTRLALREAARAKRLNLQGRKELPTSADFRNQGCFDQDHTGIPSTYWANSQINAFAFSRDHQEDYHTEPNRTFAWGPRGQDENNHYANIRVNWADVVREWPD